MRRLQYGDLSPKTRQAVALLHNALADEYPEAVGAQVTIEPVGAESPPVVDLRLLP